jgi:hypothetical protein
LTSNETPSLIHRLIQSTLVGDRDPALTAAQQLASRSHCGLLMQSVGRYWRCKKCKARRSKTGVFIEGVEPIKTSVLSKTQRSAIVLLANEIESFVEYLGDPSFVLLQDQPIQLSGIDCNALHKRTLTALRGVGVIKEWHYAVENEVLILRVKLEPRLVMATAEKIKRNQRTCK